MHAQEITFSNESFDFAYSSLVFGNIEDPGACELKSGGELMDFGLDELLSDSPIAT